jgi:hypothetical protein
LLLIKVMANIFNLDVEWLGTDGITAIQNLGTGAAVLVDITFNTLRARGIVGNNGNTAVSSGNNVTISNDQIQSINKTVVYNYQQLVAGVDVSLCYNSPSGVASNGILDIDGVTQTGLALLDYQPKPRQKEAVYSNFTTTATNGTQNNSVVKFLPNLNYATDYSIDSFLGVGTDNKVYFINILTSTITLMTDYSGNPLSITNAKFIAMDQDDGILFYNKTSDNFIRAYNFCTGTDTSVINMSGVHGWSGTINGLYFNQVSHVLTIISSNNIIYQTTVKPYNQLLGLLVPLGTIIRVNFVPPDPASVPLNICFNDETNTPYIVYTASSLTQIYQMSPVGVPTVTFESSSVVEGSNVNYAICNGSSGRLYAISETKVHRFNYGSSLENTPGVLFTPSIGIISLTRSPFGILH